jgi:hypothetical protein
MVYFALESDINRLQILKPDIVGGFVFTLPPDVFLLIESGLVRRKIRQVNLSVSVEEKSDLFPFMPFSPIDKEIERVTTKCFQHML